MDIDELNFALLIHILQVKWQCTLYNMNPAKPIMNVKYINGSIRVPKSGCYTDGGDVRYCKTFIFYFFES